MSICHPTEEQKKILSHWVSNVLTAMYYKNNAAQYFHHLLCFPMSLSTYLFWLIYRKVTSSSTPQKVKSLNSSTSWLVATR
jgi:hypothetical protein